MKCVLTNGFEMVCVLGFGSPIGSSSGVRQYRYSKLFFVQRMLSTGTKSGVPVLKVVSGLSTDPATLLLFCFSVNSE